MGSWFEAFSSFLQTVTEFFIDAHNYFLGLFQALKNSLNFVYQVLTKLPSIISAPVLIILGIMVAKFIISLGKQ